MIVGLCGAICSDCSAFDKRMCNGCFAINIKNKNACGIWVCVVEKGISGCDMCEVMDCKTFKEFTDACVGFSKLAHRMKVSKD